MYIEKPMKEALSDYLKGRSVNVMWTKNDDSLDIMRLSDLLEQEENHYLVDVPEMANPEAEQPSADQIIQAVHETQKDDVTPPLTRHRERRTQWKRASEKKQLS